jgi:hypothetical protein
MGMIHSYNAKGMYIEQGWIDSLPEKSRPEKSFRMSGE